MLRSINKYLKDNEFSLNVWNNHVSVNNFNDIVSLDDNCIILSYSDGLVKIVGKNISIKRLSNHEILLFGIFNTIKLGEQYD